MEEEVGRKKIKQGSMAHLPFTTPPAIVKLLGIKTGFRVIGFMLVGFVVQGGYPATTVTSPSRDDWRKCTESAATGLACVYRASLCCYSNANFNGTWGVVWYGKDNAFTNGGDLA